MKKWAIGLDVGSVAVKGVIYDGAIWHSIIEPTGWAPKNSARQVHKDLLRKVEMPPGEPICTVGTGYGRVNLDVADRVFSEITCHARGARLLFPHTSGILDIGGQDSKAIALDEAGRVKEFVLNDKCAAGTGRFLQLTAQMLGLEVDKLDLFDRNIQPVEIASMCAVFAESEIVGLLAQDVPQERIIAGVLAAIARRSSSMAARLGLTGHVTFCGGVAKNRLLTKFIQDETGWNLEAPEDPQIVGALGAAALAYEMNTKRGDI
ncbi:MAG: acyl-CoA dehydratase activase [Clostridia bacterium]|nr:acyl-CoA dehydratase activase [Clostridia bacterium]